MRYDFLVVGSGLYGSVFAQQCKERKKTCLVLEKNNHIAGNCYTEKINDIDVHRFGCHIFFCNNEEIWNYANRFAKFNQYTHRVKVNYKDNLYSFPINLMTLYQIYGVRTPEEAKDKLNKARIPIKNSNNLEEWCLSHIGEQLYSIFVKGYTKKHWKKDPKDLPVSIIKRIPIRLNFDDSYHHSKWSGIPQDGYTSWINNMLDGIKVELNTEFTSWDYWKKYAKNLLYTGSLDRYFNYEFGELEYRSLKFDTKIMDLEDYQGASQINYTDENIPYTRIIEHKHFNWKNNSKTIVTWEYSDDWDRDKTPYYPVNTNESNALQKKYEKLMESQTNMFAGGRLGNFRYLDMHQICSMAINKAKFTCV